jgi:hypothetical protein
VDRVTVLNWFSIALGLYAIPVGFRAVSFLSYYDLLFLGALLVVLMRGTIRGEVLVRGLVPTLLAVMTCTCLLSVFLDALATNSQLAAYNYRPVKYYIVYLGAFVLGSHLQSCDVLRSRAELILVGIFSLSALCLVDLRFGQEVASVFLPSEFTWTDGSGAVRTASTPADALATEDGRLRLFDGNPSVVAICMLVFVYPAVFGALEGRSYSAVRTAAAAVSGTGIVLMTRSLAGAVVIALFAIGLLAGKTQLRKIRLLLLSTVGFSAVVGIVGWAVVQDLGSRFTPEHVSTALSTRWSIYASAVSLPDSPIFGTALRSGSLGHYHSQLFGAIHEGGIVGLLLILCLDAVLFMRTGIVWKAAKHAHQDADYKVAALTRHVVLGLLVLQVVDAPLYIPWYCSFVFLLVGVLYNDSNTRSVALFRAGRRRRARSVRFEGCR